MLIENYLNRLHEYEDEPNLIRYCMNTYDCPKKQIKCLRILKNLTAMNPFYQHRIDRFIDAITQTYEPTAEPGMVPEVQESFDVDASGMMSRVPPLSTEDVGEENEEEVKPLSWSRSAKK